MQYIVYFVYNNNILYVESDCTLEIENNCFYFKNNERVRYIIPISNVKYIKITEE